MNKTQHWRNERQFARTVRHEAKRRHHRKGQRTGRKTPRARVDFPMMPMAAGRQYWGFLRFLFMLTALLPQFNYRRRDYQRTQPINYKRRAMAYESHK